MNKNNINNSNKNDSLEFKEDINNDNNSNKRCSLLKTVSSSDSESKIILNY